MSNMIQRGESKYPITFHYSFRTSRDHTKEINNLQTTRYLFTEASTKLLSEVYFAPVIQRTDWKHLSISTFLKILWATLKAGMTERRNGGITEWRKTTPNPKRRNRGITERRKIPPNPKRRNPGTAENTPKS